MLFRCNAKKTTVLIMLIVGIISLAFGIIAAQTAPADASDYEHFLGMLTGFGSGLTAFALFFLLRARFMSPEKKKKEEIEHNDERNIAIQRAAFTVSALAALLLFALLAFVFTGMGYRPAAYLCIGAMYVQLLAYLIAYLIFRKKM